MLKKLLLGLCLCMLVAPVSAFELDWSADDDIRQNYNPSKLEEEVLPGLPNILNNTPTPSHTQTTIKNEATQVKSPTPDSMAPVSNIQTEFSSTVGKVKKTTQPTYTNDSFTAIKIKKGTKIKVQSRTKVSDWNTAGARMTFVSTEPVIQRYLSLPVGTTFKGVIEDSHQPNNFGNGGLLKLKADSIIINGKTQNLDAKVIRANGKIIIANNIKGERGYIKGISNAVAKGDKFYKKTRRTSQNLANNPVGVIISPFPTIIGVVGYTVNWAVSPITAMWSKGEHITIPSGANYTLKLRDNAYIY